MFYFLSIVTLIWGLYLYTVDNGVPEQGIIGYVLLISTIISYYFHGVRNDPSLFKNWIRPTYLLLFGLLVVNFQTILNVLLGFAVLSDYLKSSIYNNYLYKVLGLSICSIVAFLYGGSRMVRQLKIDGFVQNDVSKKELSVWIFFNVIFFGLFIYSIDFYSFISGLDYMGSGAADRKIASSSYFEQLYMCSVIICIALYTKQCALSNVRLSIADYIKKMPRLFLVTTVAYILLRMLSGDRGPVIYTICALLYAYFIVASKRVGIVKVFTLVITGAFFISILGFVRDMDSSASFFNRFSEAVTFVNDKDSSPSILPVTQELANSVNCNFIAVKDISENKTDLRLGIYNLFAILGSIPGSSYILNGVLGVDLRDKMSSEYITTSFFGKDYPLGLGTTAIADIYLDFGLFGCILLFAFFGSVYRKIDLIFDNSELSKVSIFWFIFIIKISSLAIYTSRFSFSGTLSAGIYVLIIYGIVKFIFFRKTIS